MYNIKNIYVIKIIIVINFKKQFIQWKQINPYLYNKKLV